MPTKRLLAVFCIFALVTLACGITVDLGTSSSNASTPTSSGVNQVSTMVAQTLQALTQEALSLPRPILPHCSPHPLRPILPLPPILSVSVATNCYAGPSTHYGFVITIYPGMTVAVIGKDMADNYWIIDVPNYPGTICWLSGQYASVDGNTNNLSAPATPAVSIYTLNEPTNLRISCTSLLFQRRPPLRHLWWHNGSSGRWSFVGGIR